MRTIESVKAALRQRLRAMPVQKFGLEGYPGIVVALPYSVNTAPVNRGTVDILGIPCEVTRLPEAYDTSNRFCWHGLLRPLRPIPESWLIDLNADSACEHSTDYAIEVQEVERGLFCALVDGEWDTSTLGRSAAEAWEYAIRAYPNAHYMGVN